MTSTPSFVTIGHLLKKFKWEHIHTQNSDLIDLFPNAKNNVMALARAHTHTMPET